MTIADAIKLANQLQDHINAMKNQLIRKGHIDPATVAAMTSDLDKLIEGLTNETVTG